MLKTVGQALESPYPDGDCLRRGAQRVGGSGGGENVLQVVPARNRDLILAKNPFSLAVAYQHELVAIQVGAVAPDGEDRKRAGPLADGFP